MSVAFPALDELIRFWLLTVRIGALVLALPFWGARVVPGHLKILLVFLLSFGLYPAIQTQPIAVPPNVGVLALFVLGEVFIGITMGFVVQLTFLSVQLSGELVSQQMGMSLATLFDPQNASQSSLIANFQYIVSVLLFFSTFAHHWFILALAESLHRIPLLEFTASKTVAMSLIALLAQACVMAIKIAAPVLVTLLLVSFGLGIVARLVPQMNVFVLSFPVSLGTGLLVLSLALSYLLGEIRVLFGQLGRDLVTVIRLLGEG
jgi:flagellar biosynthetic protein FliR